MILSYELLITYLLISFIIGASLGSFMNVVLLRLEKNKSILKEKWSRCPKCKHRLNFLDLIPIFSFMFLKRKCRYCKKKISWRYLIIEIISGFCVFSVCAVYFFNIYNLNLNLEYLDYFYLLFLIVSAELLLFTFFYDLKTYLIENWIIIAGIGLSIGHFFIFQNNDQLSQKLLWTISSLDLSNDFWGKFLTSSILAIITTSIFWAIHYFPKGKWLGGGDVKLILWLSLMFGWPLTWFVLLFGFILGSTIGIYLIIKNKKNLKSRLPLGPFLTLSAFVIMLVGDKVIDIYLKTLGL